MTSLSSGVFVVLLSSVAWAAAPQSPIIVSFEGIPGIVAMSNVPGSVVPATSRLSTQLQATTGAVFRSESGEAFVPVAAASPVSSEPNAIGGARAGGLLDYNTTVIVEFYVPGKPSVEAVTDFVSITTDLAPIGPQTGAIENLTLQAFDVGGTLLGSASTLDVAPGGFILSLTIPGIHSVRLVEEGATNAWDDLTFNPVSCPPTIATQSVRLGSPANPNAYLPGSTGPVIGATWNPSIDHTSFLPGATLDVVGLSFGPLNLPLPGLGTLLCDPATIIILPPSPAGAAFAISIPNDCALAGVSLCTQGVSIDNSGTLKLTNALDITIGTL